MKTTKVVSIAAILVLLIVNVILMTVSTDKTKPSAVTALPAKPVVVQKPDVLGLWNNANIQRTNAGLHPLKLDQRLDVSADSKCADMVANKYWSHDSPSGKTPWSFIDSSLGYHAREEGENLSLGYSSNDRIVSAWMSSTEHRANLLRASYNSVGYGICKAPNLDGYKDAYLVVQHFANE